MKEEACHIMENAEVLNATHSQYPLYHGVLYGDKVLCAKLSKRISCTIKVLPIRLEFSYEYDTQKALESGVRKDPTFVVDGVILIEGILQAEEILILFKNFIQSVHLDKQELI